MGHWGLSPMTHLCAVGSLGTGPKDPNSSTSGKKVGYSAGPDPLSVPASPEPLPGRRPARLRASRKIHSTWPLALRISSAAQRSTAAQTSGSTRSGYCFLAAVAHTPY